MTPEQITAWLTKVELRLISLENVFNTDRENNLKILTEMGDRISAFEHFMKLQNQLNGVFQDQLAHLEARIKSTPNPKSSFWDIFS